MIDGYTRYPLDYICTYETESPRDGRPEQDEYRDGMVRRATARVSLGEMTSLRKRIRPSGRDRSPGQDEMCACLSLQVARSLTTNLGVRLRTRRCDCSFVLAAPTQTSVGKLSIRRCSEGKWERKAFPSRRRLFLTCLGWHSSRPLLVAARQHRPRDTGELVRHGDYDDVLVGSGVQSVEPRSNRHSFTLDPQHGRSCTVDQDLAQKTFPRLLMPNSLALPPVEYCRGMMPSEAANCRPYGSLNRCRLPQQWPSRRRAQSLGSYGCACSRHRPPRPVPVRR